MFFSLSQQIFVSICATLLSLFTISRFPIIVRPSQSERKIVIQRPSLCRTSSIFQCEHCIPEPLHLSSVAAEEPLNDYWAFDSKRDARNYGLTDAQCNVAFPGLFADIDAFVFRGKASPITRERLDRTEWPKGTLRAMIYDNELYVINHTKPEMRGVRAMATLHALHRAVITSPVPLPNAEFAIGVDDFADDPGRLIWSYTRSADDVNTWLMPDFGFWSYGETNTLAALGSWAQVRRRMEEVEEEYSSFSMKTPKLFWRGETALAQDLREELVKRTEMQPWADVRRSQLRWTGKKGSKEEGLPIHEHCKFMFLMHTEGRLKYLQNCRSVIFMHTMEWIQPFEYLMVSSGPKQNYVEVARDFSDLAEKVEYYLNHLDEAERIADNSVWTFRDRYNTVAAEACYWRRLIRGWREISFEPEFYDTSKPTSQTKRRWRGTPFENYALSKRIDHTFGDY